MKWKGGQGQRTPAQRDDAHAGARKEKEKRKRGSGEGMVERPEGKGERRGEDWKSTKKGEKRKGTDEVFLFVSFFLIHLIGFLLLT